MKRVAYLLMTFSFVLIVSGGVSSFVAGLKADRKEIYQRVHEVEDVFETFSTNTSVFESERDNLYTKVFDNLFYDTMYQEDRTVKNKLSNYEQLVDELTKNMEDLNRLCEGVYYPDATTNSRCVNYKTIYEQIINYFVSDMEHYNELVDKYNTYEESLGTLLRIRKYSTDKKYIDFNVDGQYDGREG